MLKVCAQLNMGLAHSYTEVCFLCDLLDKYCYTLKSDASANNYLFFNEAFFCKSVTRGQIQG